MAAFTIRPGTAADRRAILDLHAEAFPAADLSRLVAGLARLAQAGSRAVFVLGAPGFYGRFGFSPATAVVPPYPLPAAYREGWQCRMLGAGPRPRGTLAVPPPWRDPALWAP